VFLGEVQDVRFIEIQWRVVRPAIIFDSFQVVFPDLKCSLAVQSIVEETEMDTRLERPVDLTNTVRGKKKNTLPLCQLRFKGVQ
jgi:hypothetical protein